MFDIFKVKVGEKEILLFLYLTDSMKNGPIKTLYLWNWTNFRNIKLFHFFWKISGILKGINLWPFMLKFHIHFLSLWNNICVFDCLSAEKNLESNWIFHYWSRAGFRLLFYIISLFFYCVVWLYTAEFSRSKILLDQFFLYI